MICKRFHTMKRVSGYGDSDSPNGWKKAVIEEWKVLYPIKLKGAKITLLCDKHLQDDLDLYGCISEDPNFIGKDKEDTITAGPLKRTSIFYGQRDAYSYCRGINDLTTRDYLPCGTYFKIKKGTKLYFKGLAVNGSSKEGRFDVLIDLLYEKVFYKRMNKND